MAKHSHYISVLFCLLTLSFIEKSHAQEPEISLKRYSASDGLPDNSIRAICFDSKGFLWVGTEEGLSRFDGEEFVNYNRSSDGGNLSGNIISEIVEDEEGWLWLATQDGGICRFNPMSQETFHPQLIEYGGSEQNLAYTLALFPKGGMMVGTDKGIYYSQDRKTFTRLNEKMMPACYKMLSDNGNIITAETREGSRCFDRDFKTFEPVNPEELSKVGFLNTVYIDADNRCWLGAWNNLLYEFNQKSGAIVSYDFIRKAQISSAQDEVMCITENGPEQLWIGTKNGALWAFDKQSGNAHLLPVSKREIGKRFGNKVLCLYTDKYGRIWIGTNNGLHVYDKTTSRFDINYVDEHLAITSFERVEEALYIGGLGALYQLKNNEITQVLDSLYVYSLLKDENLNLLIGTNSALKKFDKKKNKLSFPLSNNSNSSLSNFDVNNVSSSRFTFIQSYRDILFVNVFGYGVIDIEKDFRWKMNFTHSQDGNDNLLNGMFEDSKGRLWMFGTLSGLMLCDISKLNKFSINGYSDIWLNQVYNIGLKSKHITAMVEFNDGSLWVSTLGGGLYRFFPENESQPFVKIKSPFQSIRDMVSDINGNLWMIASGALLSYDRISDKWQKFDERDGIPKDGLTGCLFKDTDGTIYAGGNGFYLHFNPQQMIRGTEQPRTVITHLRVMDEQRDEYLNEAAIVLPHNRNFLTIDFSSLCFSNPSSATFKYMLRGMDKEWRDNGTTNTVTFSALPSGEYEFLVKAISAEGVEDPHIASIAIQINSPFYTTWWFLTVLILIVLSIVYVIIRARNEQKAKLELVRNKIARDLHDDIGSALGSISFFSETAKRTLESNNSSNTSLVLDKIGSTSREMIENMHDIVWAVNPINDTFDRVIERMKSYGTDLAAANNIRLKFKTDMSLSTMRLSMTERKNIFLIYKEALYNSVKYSSCTEILVTMQQNRSEKIRLSISDNGVGFEPESNKGKGNGLRNMKNRSEEMNGTFTIRSQPNSGTEITVVLK